MKNSSASLFIMLGYFTRLPVPKIKFTEERFMKSMLLMPLVGLVIGAILVLIRFVLLWIGAPDLISGAVLVSAYIFLTGGLHFDGLADTCDGIFSGRTREQSLEIMKDSRIGVFGTLGLFMTGLFYFASFAEIPIAGLLVFPVCGRACCLISASLAPYAREEGMGKATSMQGGAGAVASAVISLVGSSFLTIPLSVFIVFAGRHLYIPFVTSSSDFYTALLIKQKFMDIFVTASLTSLIACALAAIVTIIMTKKIRKKLGGVTGDTFGAVIEVSSLVYMFVFIIFWRYFAL
jgi:adenosylcobinamide-GDP ribazoletransferase